MALIFWDGMDSYSTYSEMLKRWTSNSGGGWGSTDGRFSGGAFNATFSGYILKTLASSVATAGTLNFAFWFKTGAGTQSGFVQFDTTGGGGGGQQMFNTNSSGQPVLYKLGSGTAIITGSTNICDGQYHWVEVTVTLQTSATGSAQMWVDGISQGSVSSTVTLNGASWSPVTGIRFGNGSSTTTYFDDVLVWDATGSFFNTTNIGPQKISTLKPSGDSTPLQFTPDTGTTHYSQITGGFSNAHYVQDGSTGNVDMYTYPSLGYTPATVRAVIANMYAQNPGTGTPSLIPKLKTSSTTVSGTTITLSSGGVNNLYSQVWYQDATNTNWTASTVNSSTVGIGD